MTQFRRIDFSALNFVDQRNMRRLDVELLRNISEFHDNAKAILDRGLSFNDNADCRLVSFSSSATPNAENTVPHGLGKVPTGYIVYRKDKAAHVYDGGTSWTATNIYLKVDVATVAVKIIVF